MWYMRNIITHNLRYESQYLLLQDYLARSSGLPELGDAERRKLRQLSIVSLAANQKILPYNLLLRELDIVSVRELEDLIIEAIYQGLIKGQLDQNRSAFMVQYAIGRDIGPGDVSTMMQKLGMWLEASKQTQERLEIKIKEAEQVQVRRLEEEERLKMENERVVSEVHAKRYQTANEEGLRGAEEDDGGMIGNMMGIVGGGSRKRGKGARTFHSR